MTKDFPISKEQLDETIVMIMEQGYISGVIVKFLDGKIVMLVYKTLKITPAGIDYLHRDAEWAINRDNRGEHLKKLCEKCKKNIDNLGVTKDNVKEISSYAEIMYNRGRYDEVEAEFVTLKRKKVR